MDPAGAFIWIHDYTEFADTWQQIIARCQHLGLRGAFIKAWDGEWRWERQWSRAVVEQFHAAGLLVAPWGYTVGQWQGPAIDTPQGPHHNCTIDLDTASAAWAIEQGGDFLIVDPEIEWCRQYDPADHATRYLTLLRERIGAVPLYASTVPITSGYWQGNPLRTIAEHVDGLMPQVYCQIWGQPGRVAEWVHNAAALSYGKPTYPVFDLANNEGLRSTPSYLRDATAAAIANGCPGLSLWHYPLLSPLQEATITLAAAQVHPGPPATQTMIDNALWDELQALDNAGYRYLVGLCKSRGAADLSSLGGPRSVRWLELEKSVIWSTDGRTFDAMHPGQLDALLASGAARRNA